MLYSTGIDQYCQPLHPADPRLSPAGTLPSKDGVRCQPAEVSWKAETV